MYVGYEIHWDTGFTLTPEVGVATPKFSAALRTPVAEPPLSKFLNPPLECLRMPISAFPALTGTQL